MWARGSEGPYHMETNHWKLLGNSKYDQLWLSRVRFLVLPSNRKPSQAAGQVPCGVKIERKLRVSSDAKKYGARRLRFASQFPFHAEIPNVRWQKVPQISGETTATKKDCMLICPRHTDLWGQRQLSVQRLQNQVKWWFARVEGLRITT